jgi:Transposase DDE domain
MFVDPNRQDVWDKIRHRDSRAFAPWLTRAVIEQAATRAGVALGGGPLCLFVLVWLAIACALHPTKSFAAVLGLALKLMRNDPHWDPNAFLGADQSAPTAATKARAKARAKAKVGARSGHGPAPPRSKHDPRGSGDPFRVSAAAFTQARAAMPWAFWVALVLILADRFEDQHADLIRFKHFRLLALDGTCLKLDRWGDLVARAGTSENGKGLPTPQARLVLLQLPLVRLPVRFELFPYSVGERTVATKVLEALRRDDLVLIDRGFWSYGLFCQVGRSQAHFAIRQMSGVAFKTLESLGAQDRLVRWTPSDRQWKDEGLPDSLRLRVIAYQIKGFRPSAVVTSVLDPTVISRDEFVRLATVDQAGRTLDAGLYHRRWEIETTLAEIKVTQGMDGSFRSRTTEGIAFEVAGHLLLHFLVRRQIVEAALAAGVPPLRLSYKGALEDVKDMRESLLKAGERPAQRILLPRLCDQIGSHVIALRPGRHYPRPNDTKVKDKGKGKKQLPTKLGAGADARPSRRNKGAAKPERLKQQHVTNRA